VATSGHTGAVFVGRHQEIAELNSALDDAIAGHGRLVMLAGEPGIGKTSIAQELTSRARSLGTQVFWGWCYEREGAPPYWPWVQPIQSYISQTPVEQLLAELGSGASDIADLVPEIRQKLPDLEPSPTLDPQQTRFRLFNSISTFLTNLAQSQSLVFVLDDLQWADTPSLLLLEFLTQQMTDSNILVIGTYRDVEVTRRHPLSESLAQLSRSPAFSRLALTGLESDDVGQFVRESGGESASTELIDAIHTHTEGNPLFLSEVVRLLGEQSNFDARAGTAGTPIVLGLPQGVVEVIGQRLNRLSADCVDTLTMAAAIGRQFDFNLLKNLSEDASEIQLLEQVEEALDARILQELPEHRDRYQFSHAMVQQTLLERLSTSRRVRMHAKIGEALETAYGDQPGGHAEELAYHFSEAAPVSGPEKLVKYSKLAGDRALEGYAWEEAMAYFQNSLAALSINLEEQTPAPDEDSASLLFGLGRCQAALIEDGAYRSLRRALDYYAKAGDLEKVVAIAELPDYAATRNIGLEQLIGPALKLVQEGSLQSGRLLSRHGQIIGLQNAAYDEDIDALNQALDISRREGDKELEVQSLAAIVSVYSNHMHYEEALANGLKIFELNEQVNDLRSEVSAHYFVATCYIENGDLGAASRHATEMLSKAERLGDRFWLEGACWKTEMTLRVAGEWESARTFAQRALDIGSRQSNILSGLALNEHEVGNSRLGNSHLDLLTKIASDGTAGSRFMDLSASARVALTGPLAANITGDSDRLESSVNAATFIIEHPNATALSVNQAHAGLAMVAVISGDADKAAEKYELMKTWHHSFMFFCVSSDRLLGLLARTIGQLDQSAKHFDDALSFCRKGGYKPELAWASCEYADLLIERNGPGDRAKATGLFEECLAISNELGMRPLIERVARLQERNISQTAFPDGLTAREVEVIRLVALGMIDREIAEELIISPNTVGNHVRSILGKTDSANRTEAAAYAVQNGLTSGAK